MLVEATGRILPEVGEDMGRYTVERAARARASTSGSTPGWSPASTGTSCSPTASEFDTDTIVWTAGVKANPVLAAHRPAAGRARAASTCRADLRVEGVDDAWAAGDCAAVPDLTRPSPGATCAPSAQHAVRQAKRARPTTSSRVLRGGSADRLPAQATSGRWPASACTRASPRSTASSCTGFPAWFMHRTYHVSRVPTLNRKVRVVADWTLALFFRREIVSLGSLQRPREEFSEATR